MERDRKTKQLTAVVMLNYWLDYTWHPCPQRPAGKHRKTLSLHVSPRARGRWLLGVCKAPSRRGQSLRCLSGLCVLAQLIVRQINRSDWEVMYQHGPWMTSGDPPQRWINKHFLKYNFLVKLTLISPANPTFTHQNKREGESSRKGVNPLYPNPIS